MVEQTLENWRVFKSREILSDALAESLAADLRDACTARGSFTFGASGGSTPKPVYERLAAMELPWSALTVVIVDERFVSPAHEYSNQRMIAASLLQGHPEARCIGLWSDALSLDAAAKIAEKRLRSLATPMDTVLLGMGEDGHFASCFPTAKKFDAAITADGDEVVVPVTPMPTEVRPALERLTLTWSYLRQAQRIVLAITGVRKREVLLQAMHDQDPTRLPAAAMFKPGMPKIEIYWSE